MSNRVPVVSIDLTDSFCLANHGSMTNIIIELDDSINETASARPAVVLQTDAPIVDLDTTNENVSPCPPAPNRRKSKGRKKAQPHQPGNEVRHDQIRERSPLANYIGDCPICLERMGTKPLASTKCGHVFCQHCLQQALGLEKKCPTCRRPLRGNNAFHPLFLGKRDVTDKSCPCFQSLSVTPGHEVALQPELESLKNLFGTLMRSSLIPILSVISLAIALFIHTTAYRQK